MTSTRIRPENSVTRAATVPAGTGLWRTRENRFRGCEFGRAGVRRWLAGPHGPRLARHQAPVVETGARARRRGLPGDHVRPTRLRRERQARRGRGVLAPVPR